MPMPIPIHLYEKKLRFPASSSCVVDVCVFLCQQIVPIASSHPGNL